MKKEPKLLVYFSRNPEEENLEIECNKDFWLSCSVCRHHRARRHCHRCRHRHRRELGQVQIRKILSKFIDFKQFKKKPLVISREKYLAIKEL